MNRLVLIGNGFDLAHSLKTKYENFIENIGDKAFGESYSLVFKHGDDVKNSWIIINKNHPGSPPFKSYKGYKKSSYLDKQHNKVIFKNRFLGEIINSSFENWVDIEEEYYLQLKKIVLKNTNYIDALKSLNEDFSKIKQLLKEYLINETKKVNDDFIKKDILSYIYSYVSVSELPSQYILEYMRSLYKMYAEIYAKSENDEYRYADKLQFLPHERYLLDEFGFNHGAPVINEHKFLEKVKKKQMHNKLYQKPKADQELFNVFPDDILLLNFNYTNIANQYSINNVSGDVRSPKYRRKDNVINIHGSLHDDTNTMIFGYGDELDKDYAAIEDLNDNECLENVKSIRYADTDNYKQMLEFIDSDEYEVYIMGHSCGVSDRTLLNTIFEHDNCMSIKPFYYVDENGNDNYSDIIRNISRNFKDKKKMRERVVNKTYCTTLTSE